MKSPISILYLAFALLLFSCGVHTLPPGGPDYYSYVGEQTLSYKEFKNLPTPKEEVVVGVYKFKDQTGQYKASDIGANWSTAIPQGLTSILIKALEDSKWFIPIERENIGNLLNERQIIRTTRAEYAGNEQPVPVPPLLFAGIIFEGGVISYDANVMTGGVGARYFGVGGSTEYRQDRLTVYLRAVSTSNGRILKTVYTSKTLLSQAVSAGMFRYVDPERLLEIDMGISNNEPVQMAVSEAINKAVYLMVLEGIENDLWQTDETEKAEVLLDKYKQEVNESANKVVGKGVWEEDRRSKIGLGVGITYNELKGDYQGSTLRPGVKFSLLYNFSEHFHLNFSWGIMQLKAKDFFSSTFFTYDADLEYFVTPYNEFSPFLFGGIGLINKSKGEDRKLKFKTQFGGGFEYVASPTLILRGYGAYSIGNDDTWDDVQLGKRDDHYLQIGIGLLFNLENRKK